jgi:hypothetical protein
MARELLLLLLLGDWVFDVLAAVEDEVPLALAVSDAEPMTELVIEADAIDVELEDLLGPVLDAVDVVAADVDGSERLKYVDVVRARFVLESKIWKKKGLPLGRYCSGPRVPFQGNWPWELLAATQFSVLVSLILVITNAYKGGPMIRHLA